MSIHLWRTFGTLHSWCLTLLKQNCQPLKWYLTPTLMPRKLYDSPRSSKVLHWQFVYMFSLKAILCRTQKCFSFSTWLQCICYRLKLNSGKKCFPWVDFLFSLTPSSNNSWIRARWQMKKVNVLMIFLSKLSMIIWVNIVLNRTVVVDNDWCFDNLCGMQIISGTEYRR